jgi:hypothetical protein
MNKQKAQLYLCHHFLSKQIHIYDFFLAAENKREWQNREGWLKMVHQEIQGRHNELFESNDAASTKGVIKEIVNKFKTSLPYLNRNGYNYYVRQQKGSTGHHYDK